MVRDLSGYRVFEPTGVKTTYHESTLEGAMHLYLPVVPSRRFSTVWHRWRLYLATRYARKHLQQLCAGAADILAAPGFDGRQLDPLVQEGALVCAEAAHTFNVLAEDLCRQLPERRLLYALSEAWKGKTRIQMRFAVVVVQPTFPDK
jgi:hypothetical protein